MTSSLADLPPSTDSSFDTDVAIVGGGPTGLMLGAELALAGVDAIVLERRATQALPGSRGGGLHARTIELLDQRGIAERFLEAGYTAQVHRFANTPIGIEDLPTRHPYALALRQNRSEAILAEWVESLPVTIRRGCEVTGIEQDAGGVRVALASGGVIRARYAVGCDGGRSLVRRAIGVRLSGADAATSSLIAEARMGETPEVGVRRDVRGQHGIGPLGEGELFRVVVRERELVQGAEPTLDALRAAMREVWGSDFGVHSPRWLSRFTDAARQAESYRAGRVLLAGDAAHVHSPVGGQGMSLGLADAVNLGWKLARVLRGEVDEALLDTYEQERHPAAARVLHGTLAQTALMPSDPRTDALREMIDELAAMEEPRRHLGGLLSGLSLRYDLGGRHPLAGRRMPDRDLLGVPGAARVYELLHRGGGVLLSFAEPIGERAELAPWVRRIRFVDASSPGAWELPGVAGPVDPPAAVLVRPDGYVAWTGELGDPALIDALQRWFGPGIR